MAGEFNHMFQMRKLFTNIIIQRTCSSFCPVALHTKTINAKEFNFLPLTLIYILHCIEEYDRYTYNTCIIYLSSGFANI